MKKIFNKAISIASSAALIGATVGLAAASTYPEPFTGNSAIVTGVNAALSDNTAAGVVADDIDASTTSDNSGGVPTGGDSYKFEKSSTKFHLGDEITAVVSTDLDEDNLPTLLAEGTYRDDDNDDFDTEQKIVMGTSGLQLAQFEDNDYADDVPTDGIKIASGTHVLNYTFTFKDQPLIADMSDTYLNFMGKEYYVSSAAYNTLTLLDSATSTTIVEGEEVTINVEGTSYVVSISYIDTDSAKLTVNGEATENLAVGQTYTLDNGAKLAMLEVLDDGNDNSVGQVEFSIGNGELVLTHSSDIELNDDSINGVTAWIVNSTTSMDSIVLGWEADEDLFVTIDSEAVLPGFGSVKLSYTGLDLPAEEEIVIEPSSDYIGFQKFPVKDGEVDIPLLYLSSNKYAGLGQASDNGLVVDPDGNITFDGDDHDMFILTYEDSSDAESYVMRVNNFKTEDSTDKADLEVWRDDGFVDEQTEVEVGDTVSVGNAEILIGAINKAAKTIVLSNNTVDTNFHHLFSAEGARFILPHNNSAYATGFINLTGNAGVTANPAAWNLTFTEEDKDEDVAQGDTLYITLGLNSQTPVDTSVTTYYGGEATATEIGSTDVYRDWLYSALATEILHDTGGDQDPLTLMYHGGEVEAGVYLNSAAVTYGDSETGIMTYTDAESSSFAGMNLLVIGGSCINSIAADLLGGSYCSEEFTAMTDVGAGEFMIESFDRSGKTATLVAGYAATDTTKAVTYLVNTDDVSTTVGDKYIGTSATEASLVVA